MSTENKKSFLYGLRKLKYNKSPLLATYLKQIKICIDMKNVHTIIIEYFSSQCGKKLNYQLNERKQEIKPT